MLGVCGQLLGPAPHGREALIPQAGPEESNILPNTTLRPVHRLDLWGRDRAAFLQVGNQENYIPGI